MSHGTVYSYNSGCRCVECRTVATDARKASREFQHPQTVCPFCDQTFTRAIYAHEERCSRLYRTQATS